MNHDFWKGKKVLITGNTGFKGSWLSLWLQALGAQVFGFALPPITNPNLYESASIAKVITNTFGDVRNFENLFQVIKEAEPEIVFHLASQPIVRESYTDPVGTFSTNVMGTVHLLEAARTSSSITSIVVVTSDKCYENTNKTQGYSESEPLGGHDPYSNSKACAELIANAYRRSFFSSNDGVQLPNVATVRAGNVIGGGDRSQDRIIPDIIRALTNQKPLRIRNPHAIRPWQHVLDCLHGYLTVAEQLSADGKASAEAWNFGPIDNMFKPVSWLVQRASEMWGSSLELPKELSPQPYEDQKLTLDCSKAVTRLGWRPKLSLEKSLEWTIEWEKEFHKKKDACQLSLSQISNFQQL